MRIVRLKSCGGFVIVNAKPGLSERYCWRLGDWGRPKRKRTLRCCPKHSRKEELITVDANWLRRGAQVGLGRHGGNVHQLKWWCMHAGVIWRLLMDGSCTLCSFKKIFVWLWDLPFRLIIGVSPCWGHANLDVDAWEGVCASNPWGWTTTTPLPMGSWSLQWLPGLCKKAIPVFIQRQACFNVSTDDSIYSPIT